MKDHFWKRSVAALLAATMSLLQMPSGLSIAKEEEMPLYTLQTDEPSEYGLRAVHWLDEDGQEYTPDLMPEYKLRADGSEESFDLRTQGGGLPTVRNQTGTGTCWAHATIGSIESNLIEQGVEDASINLSEAHLVCFSNCLKCNSSDDPLFGEGENLGTNGYTTGGNYLIALEALASWSGYELEENAPAVQEKKLLDESFRYNSQGHVQNMELYDKTDRSAIKNSIVNNGALYMSLYYSSSSASSHNGHYHTEADAAALAEENGQSINHAVMVVGWDDNFPRSYFNEEPPGDGAWLCRNSWGEERDDKGYFYISYYDATITDFASFQVEPVNNYDHIYQYDREYAANAPVIPTYSGIAGANIFTAERNENVAAASFYTMEASTNYIVRVYKNVVSSATNPSPHRGTLVAEEKGTALYAGYHTIELSNPVSVREGTKFSVIVILDKSGMLLDKQSRQSNVSYCAYYNASSNAYTSWSTPAKGGNALNVCVKAFTRSGTVLDEENFPDPVIRAYAAKYDKNRDGILSEAEAATHTATSVSFKSQGVTNLKGLEVFKSIKELDCSSNPMAFADVSEMDLTKFTCKSCKVQLGDIYCTALTELGIDISKVSNLTGATKGTDRLIPTATTISYTYDCGGGFSAVFTLEATSLDHNYQLSPNDAETHIMTCSDCGHTATEAHSFGDWIPYYAGISYDVPAGTHYRVCALCGYYEYEDHQFGEWSETASGQHTHTCEICGVTETSDHAVNKWKSDNKTTHSGTCAECGKKFQEAHTFTAYVEGNDEVHTRTCTVCSYQEVSAHNWTYVINKLAGNHSRICSDCKRTITEDHTFGDWVINEDGTHSRTCTGCGFTETKAHTFGKYVKNADGTHTHTCTDCGYSETEEHSFGSYVQNKDGTHTHTCTLCGYAETAEHSFGAFTADENGKHSHTCEFCGYTESLSHEYGTYKDNKDGTHVHICKDCGYEETGEHTYNTKYTIAKDSHSQTCTKCGHVETTAHSFGDCTDNGDGTHSRVCADCRYVQTTAHNFGKYTTKNGVSVHTCTDCGATESLVGDATLDGKIDILDIILLQKYLHGKAAKGVTIANSDMNGDGVIDVFDLALLKREVLQQK